MIYPITQPTIPDLARSQMEPGIDADEEANAAANEPEKSKLEKEKQKAAVPPLVDMINPPVTSEDSKTDVQKAAPVTSEQSKTDVQKAPPVTSGPEPLCLDACKKASEFISTFSYTRQSPSQNMHARTRH